MDDITGLREKYLTAIDAAADEAALEEVRLAALGKKGEVSLLMRGLGGMTPGGAPDRRPRPQRAQGRPRPRRSPWPAPASPTPRSTPASPANGPT